MLKNLWLLPLLLWLNCSSTETWEDFTARAHESLSKKQEVLKNTYQLGQHERFDYDQETGLLVFSSNGQNLVVAKAQIVGTLSTKSNTWLWSWSNPSILESAKATLQKVKAFGHSRKYEEITQAKWVADEADGWTMTSVSSVILNAKGAYRVPDDHGFIYLVITDIKWAESAPQR